MKPALAVLAAVLLAALAALAAPALAGAQGQAHLVPTTPGSSGFGPFREEAGTSSAKGLRAAFGTPRSTDAERGACVLRWPGRGITVTLSTYGQEIPPCTKGYFVEARLTGRRWHTEAGIRPGSSKRKARKVSLRRCTRDSCGVTGYALELHRIDCAMGKVPGVIAQVRGRRVRALYVRTRGCE